MFTHSGKVSIIRFAIRPVWAGRNGPDTRWHHRFTGNTCWFAGTYNRNIQLYDAQTQKHQQSLSGHFGCVTSLVVSPSGGFLFSASSDATIKVSHQCGTGNSGKSAALGVRGQGRGPQSSSVPRLTPPSRSVSAPCGTGDSVMDPVFGRDYLG